MLNICLKMNPRITRLILKTKCSIIRDFYTSTAMNIADTGKTKYVTIYKFPYIRPFSLINRLKFYQTTLTGLAIPTALILNQLNFIQFDAVQFTCALGVSGCLTLYGLGYLTTQFIGFIYYNEQENLIKVAYIDFWGRRKDMKVPAKDVVPISELPESFTDGLFLKFRRYTTKDCLKYNLKYGIILNKELIKKIL